MASSIDAALLAPQSDANKATWGDEWAAFRKSRQDAKGDATDLKQLQAEVPEVRTHLRAVPISLTRWFFLKKALLKQFKAALFAIIRGEVVDGMVEMCAVPESELEPNQGNFQLKPSSVYVKLMAMAQAAPSVNCVTVRKRGEGSFDTDGRRTAKNHVLLLVPKPL